MNKNFEIIANELFDKIRAQFPGIQLGDEDSKVTDDPAEARFFKFNFEKDGLPLGYVTIHLDAESDGESDKLVVIYSNDIAAKAIGPAKHQWFNFLKELREFAKQRILDFDVRDVSKSNLEKRDYQHLSNKSGDNQMTESKFWGTNKTSYQSVGETRLIVKHSKPVSDEVPASRARYIESIYIENDQGERFKYPYKHLNGARAMARHVANGGTPYDSIGEHVIGLSEELGKLRMFKGYVDRNETVSEAMGTVQSKVIERIVELKKQIQGLQTQRFYEEFSSTFEAKEEQEIPEDLMNDWIDRLTIRTFNEELKNVFPYIFKLVGEDSLPVKELSFDDLVAESSEEEDARSLEDIIPEMDQYEAALNGIVEGEGVLSNDEAVQQEAIAKLNALLAQELPVGTDGTNATESLADIINDKELEDVFKELADINPQSDARPLIKDYIQIRDEENGTDVLSKLNFGDEQQAPAEPAPEPAAEPAPAAPVAAPATPAVAPAPVEGLGEGSRESASQAAQLLAKLAKVVKSVETPDQLRSAEKFANLVFNKINAKIVKDKGFGGLSDSTTLMNQIEADLKAKAREVGGYAKKDGIGMDSNIRQMQKMAGVPEGSDVLEKPANELHEYIESMFDKETGNFPKGETGVLLAVEKRFGEQAVPHASKYIGHLKGITESYRLKKLAGLA